MKIFLLICLVASAFAAPAERAKRNILPGDPRYDAKHHGEHDEHKHHEKDVEISKALGGFAGSFSVPDVSFGSFGLEAGDSIGSADILNHDIDASKAALAFDEVKIASHKASEELKSDSENSFTSPKVESVTIIKPSSSNGLDIATSTDSSDLVSQTTDLDADKDSSKNTDETKVEAKSSSDKSSPDFGKARINSDTTEVKSTEAFFSDLNLATDSLATPFFDSSFDSGFPSLGQSGYNPSFLSTSEYNTPKFDGSNSNYKYFNNYGGQPSGISTYSGFDQGFNSHSFDSSIPVDFSQPKLTGFTENVPYLPPYSLPSFNSETGINPSAFKFSNTQSYSSAPVGAEYQHLFKNYSPFPLAQPTSASFAGISQQTDANGGYVY